MTLVQTTVKLEAWQLEAAKLAKINLSHLLRTAVDAALNTNNDLEEEEAAILNQKAIIAAREEMLAVKKQHITQVKSEELQETIRRKWLQEHPNFLDAYLKGTLSSRAWQTLNRELKFSNKKHTEDFLQRYTAEISDYSPANNCLSQHGDKQHFTGLNVIISEVK